MNLELSDTQLMLRDLVARFLRETALAGASSAREDRWRRLAEDLGLMGAPFSEELGGLGGGAVSVMVVMEEFGAALADEPYLETVVLGGGLLSRCGGDRATALLEAVIAGDCRLAFAHDEPNERFSSERVATKAVSQADGGWRLDGRKLLVVDAPNADYLLVSARTSNESSDGVSLFLVERDTPGLRLHSYRLVDMRPAADLELEDVRLPAEALLGARDLASPMIARIIDDAIAALCAEAVGLMRAMLDATVRYTKDRTQFGQPIAKFQVLQHRMVDMYMEQQRAAAAALLATLSLDAAEPERTRAISAAKVTIADAVRFVAQNAVQLHGAMGLSEEMEIGRYFRRAMVIEQRFGSREYYLRRYAEARSAADG